MIPYIENFLSRTDADALFEFIKTQPFERPANKRNKTSRLRRLSFPGYSPPLTGHHTASRYGVAGDIATAPPPYKQLAAQLTEYAASVPLPTPVNYLSTVGYLTDDHMNFHQHREDKVREDQTVYVVSLGAVHPVSIRPLGCKDEKQYETFYPKHGSLYVLPSSCNETHEHAVLEGNDVSFGGLRIAINCKHIPAALSADEMKRACSRPAGAPSVRKTGTSSLTSPRVCWGTKADFPDAVYVGKANSRGKFKYEETPWGNYEKRTTTTTPTFRQYAEKLLENAHIAAEFEALRGKDLLCPWCKPGEKDCHAKVWLELANK